MLVLLYLSFIGALAGNAEAEDSFEDSEQHEVGEPNNQLSITDYLHNDLSFIRCRHSSLASVLFSVQCVHFLSHSFYSYHIPLCMPEIPVGVSHAALEITDFKSALINSGTNAIPLLSAQATASANQKVVDLTTSLLDISQVQHYHQSVLRDSFALMKEANASHSNQSGVHANSIVTVRNDFHLIMTEIATPLL